MMNSHPITTLRAWTLALLGASLLSLGAACGASGVDAEEVAETQVALMTDMVAILNSVDDLDSLQAAKPKMRELGEELAARTKEWKAQAQTMMADPGSAQAMAKSSQEMAAVGQRLSAAYMKLAMNPELREHLSELGEAMGSALKDGMR